MTRRLEAYRFRDGVTPLNERELNSRLFDIDARLDAIEQLRVSYEAAISELQVVVAERTADFIPPLIQSYQDNLAFLDAESARLRAEAAALVTAMGADRAAQQAALDAELASERAALNALLAEYQGAVVRPNQLRGGPASLVYDAGGRVSTLTQTLPAGSYILAYAYAAGGELQSIAAGLAGTPLWTRTYSYDAGGQLTGWTEG